MKCGGGTKQEMITWCRATLHPTITATTTSVSWLWVFLLSEWKSQSPQEGWETSRSAVHLFHLFCSCQSSSIITGCRATTHLTAYWAKRTLWMWDYFLSLFSHAHTKMHYIIVSFHMNPHLFSIDRIGFEWLPSTCTVYTCVLKHIYIYEYHICLKLFLN